jgi:hypothetical protein
MCSEWLCDAHISLLKATKGKSV